ncbi:MAG: S8 family peptidase [Lachnospiraceae bacterium]|nr:S8 family peptidase [Lachnospiraceae bacterium]
MTCKERILSNDYADIITDFVIPERFNYQIPVDNCIHQVMGDLRILYIKKDAIPRISISDASYYFIPRCYGLTQLEGMGGSREYNSIALMEAGILATQGQPLNLTGKNVTIGFIDTGIQYENEVFRDATGRSRITAIWDQTIQTGTPPEGFLYGTEYTNEMIQRAIESDNPRGIVPSTDEIGHGTAAASVAAGSRLEGNRQFIGAAPESNIVMVKLKEMKQYLREYYLIPEEVPCYSETDIMQAVQYLQKYAMSLSSPLVVYMGVGTNLGDHTGASPLARYITAISYQKSRAFVIGGGNEGNARRHFRGTISGRQEQQDVELRVGEGEKGFIMDFWGKQPYLFSASVRSPGGEMIQRINPRIKGPQTYTFIFERTRITVDYILVEPSSNAEMIRFRFENPTAGIWTIRIQGEGSINQGEFDLWLPITQFLTDETYFLEPDPFITLTDPAYARRVVSVTSYNDENDSLYVNAGRGFSRDEQIKPDIAAPGVNVSTILGMRNGSSIAAAITAGGVAQILQWAVVEQNDILVDSESIRNYLIRGATRDENMEYPNREYGYGLLNIEGVFRFLAGTS